MVIYQFQNIHKSSTKLSCSHSFCGIDMRICTKLAVQGGDFI